MVGEPKESYIYIEPEVGKAFESAIVSQLGFQRDGRRNAPPPIPP
jgi:hypothetical protein